METTLGNGPFKASLRDVTFCQCDGSKRHRLLADSGCNGESVRITTPNPHDPKVLWTFKVMLEYSMSHSMQKWKIRTLNEPFWHGSHQHHIRKYVSQMPHLFCNPWGLMRNINDQSSASKSQARPSEVFLKKIDACRLYSPNTAWGRSILINMQHYCAYGIIDHCPYNVEIAE